VIVLPGRIVVTTGDWRIVVGIISLQLI